MPRNRIGRPSLSTSRARSHRVATFVTQSELNTLRAFADENGKSVSMLVYELLSLTLPELKQAQKPKT